LEAIRRAKPSKRSFLAEVLAAKNPAQFIPASVADEMATPYFMRGPH
jgi:hypothetical protein